MTDGNNPFVGVQPNASGGGTTDDGEAVSVIGESPRIGPPAFAKEMKWAVALVPYPWVAKVV